MPLSPTFPPPTPFLMVDSLHSSQTTATALEKDHDPEAIDKVEDAVTPVESDHSSSEKGPSPWEVTLEENEDPKSLATWYKWVIVLTISSGAMCVTAASSMVSATRYVNPIRI